MQFDEESGCVILQKKNSGSITSNLELDVIRPVRPYSSEFVRHVGISLSWSRVNRDCLA